MNEIKRLQQLAGILTEIKVNDPLEDNEKFHFMVIYDDEDDNDGECETFNLIKKIIPTSEIEVGDDYISLYVPKKQFIMNIKKMEQNDIKVIPYGDGYFDIEWDGNSYTTL